MIDATIDPHWGGLDRIRLIFRPGLWIQVYLQSPHTLCMWTSIDGEWWHRDRVTYKVVTSNPDIVVGNTVSRAPLIEIREIWELVKSVKRGECHHAILLDRLMNSDFVPREITRAIEVAVAESAVNNAVQEG